MAGNLDVLNMVDVAFLKNPPSFVGTQSVTQNIGNSVWVSVSIDTTQYDNYTGHSNVTNNSRYTCQLAGWYTVNGVISYSANGTGSRAARISVNGSPISGGCGFIVPPSANAAGVVTPTRDIQLNVNDYVEIQAWQSSGGTLATSVFSDVSTAMWVRFSHF